MRHDHPCLRVCHSPSIDGMYIYIYIYQYMLSYYVYIYMYQPTMGFLQHSLVARFQSIPSFKKRIPSVWKRRVMFVTTSVNRLCRKHLVNIAPLFNKKGAPFVCLLIQFLPRLDKSGASAASSSSSPGVVVGREFSGCLGPQKMKGGSSNSWCRNPSSARHFSMEILIESTHLIKKHHPVNPVLEYHELCPVVITSIYKINYHFTR